MSVSDKKFHLYDLAFLGQIFALVGFSSSCFSIAAIVCGLMGIMFGRNRLGYGGGTVRSEAAKAILFGTFASFYPSMLDIFSHCANDSTASLVTMYMKRSFFSFDNFILGIGTALSAFAFAKLGNFITLKPDEMLNMLFYNLCFAGAVGSLAVPIYLFLHNTPGNPPIFGDMFAYAMTAGIIGGFIAMMLYVLQKKRSLFRFLDLWAIQSLVGGIFFALCHIRQSYQTYQSLRGEIWSFWGAPQGYWPISIIAYGLVLGGLYYGFRRIKWRGIVYVGYGVFNLALTLIVSLCMYDNPRMLLFPSRYGGLEIVAKLGYEPFPMLAAYLLGGIVVFILICIFRTWRPDKRQEANLSEEVES